MCTWKVEKILPNSNFKNSFTIYILINPPSSESHLLLTYLCNYWCIYHLSYIFLERLLEWKLKFTHEVKQVEIFEKFALGDFEFFFPVSLFFANSYWLYFNEEYRQLIIKHLTFSPFMISLPFSFICGAGPGGPGGPLTPCSPCQQQIQNCPLKTEWYWDQILLRSVTLKRTTTGF